MIKTKIEKPIDYYMMFESGFIISSFFIDKEKLIKNDNGVYYEFEKYANNNSFTKIKVKEKVIAMSDSEKELKDYWEQENGKNNS